MGENMPGASIIIGIHGLANKPPLDEKRQWWKQALVEGLRRNCGKTTNELPFDFLYWADLRYPSPVSDLDNTQPYWEEAGAGLFPAYRTHKWTEIINAAETIVGNELDFFELQTGIAKVSDYVLEKKLTDLATYYEDANFRIAVRKRLSETILQYRDQRIMLVGHSMGSIIAYDVLRLLGREAPQLRIDHFVTIGSPLGMPHVKYKISQENDLVRTPSIVGRWTNFAARRDVVAIDAKLGDDYEPNDQGVKVLDVPVINAYRGPADKLPANSPNYHKSYGYLRTPELSEVVRAFV